MTDMSPREIARGFMDHKAEHGCNTLLSPQESEAVCRAIAAIDPAVLRDAAMALRNMNAAPAEARLLDRYVAILGGTTQ